MQRIMRNTMCVSLVVGMCTVAYGQASSLGLANYEITRSFALPLPIATEASGMTFNWDTGTLFIVGDEGFGIVEMARDGTFVSSMAFSGFEDPESITYIGNGEFVVAEERLQSAFKLTYAPGGSVHRSTLPSASLGPPIGNVGIEGISFEPSTGLFFAVKEKSPQAVLQASLDFTGPATIITPLFDPEAKLGLLDLAGIQVLSMVPGLQGTVSQDNLLILSQESSRLVEVTRQGVVVGEFDMTPFSAQAEGVTIDFDGVIYICDESPRVFVLEPQYVRIAWAEEQLPHVIAPGAMQEVRVRITPGVQGVAPGTARVHFRKDAAGVFESLLLAAVPGEPDEYSAMLPAFACGDAPEVYFTVEGDKGAQVRMPREAGAVFTARIGELVSESILQTSFNVMWPAGWSATGLWHVANACAPVGNVVEGCEQGPYAYFGRSVTCNYVLPAGTHNGTLTAPAVTLPVVLTGESISLSFCYALETEQSPFLDVAELLINGEQRPEWRLADVRPTASMPDLRWSSVQYDLTEFAGEVITLSWRFNTVNALNNNFRGWHLNNVNVEATLTSCEALPCYANCDGSMTAPVLNVDDFTCFISAFAASQSLPQSKQIVHYSNCDGSTSAPVLNVDDFTCFINAFSAGCP